EQMDEPRCRSRETNDGSEQNCRPKQSGRHFEKFGKQDAAERGNRRPCERLPARNCCVHGGAIFVRWEARDFPAIRQSRKTIASPALVYIVGPLWRHLFRGKSAPRLCALLP